MSAISELKAAALAALLADAGVAALVDQRVYDIAPSDPRGNTRDVKTPFVYLALITFHYEEIGCGDGTTVRLRFHSVSQAAQRDEAWDVLTAVRTCLRNAEFIITGGMTPLRVVAGGEVLERAGDIIETFIDFDTTIATD